MYGQYHLPRGKNPALSCLIGFVSMDRAKQQNYSTIQYKWQFTGPSCRLLLRRKSGALAFINLLVPFADMWDIKLPGPRAIPEYSAEQPGWSTQSWRRRSNEQWGVKSQSCTFPAVKLEGQSNNAKKEVGGTKQPSFHSLLNPLLPHLLQLNHVLLLPLFCLMWDVDRLGKALTRGTAC